MTYYEITKKMKDLTMTTSDWSWLSKYLIETGSAHVYSNFSPFVIFTLFFFFLLTLLDPFYYS